MAKIYVHIDTVVGAADQSTKKQMTTTLKSGIEKMLISYTAGSLPKEKYTTKKTDKPNASESYNAIKVSNNVKLTFEKKGLDTKVSCELKMDFTAIKMPNTKSGSLLGAGSTRSATQNRGHTEKAISGSVDDCLAAAVGPLVKKIITNPRFKSYATSLGLPV